MAPLFRHYSAILADPPWRFATYSAKGKGRNAEAHYDCMAPADIKALPVAEWAAPDCALFLWATDPSVSQALDVIASWGFAVAFTWVKTTKDGAGFPIGCGYWTRANSEQCLLATRGRPQRLLRSVRQLILAPRILHSQKPLTMITFPYPRARVTLAYCTLVTRVGVALTMRLRRLRCALR
jgi:N6-adenosine-specific RNA methylase IME4